MRRMKRALAVLACIACSGSACAQAPGPNALPAFDYKTAQAHELQPHRLAVPLNGVPKGSHQLVLTLVVSPSGDVVDAKAQGAPDDLKFWPQTEGEVRGWKFTPFERSGKPVKAQVGEFIDLLPPERLPTTHVTPPTVRVGSRIVIVLSRSGCLGTCPVYTVTVTNSAIVFEGRYYVAQTGKQTGKADAEAVRKLAEKFVSSDFYSMDPEYNANAVDVPTYTLSIEIDGRGKMVKDSVGSWVGMPAAITELENDVDNVAQTDRWIENSK